jgi:serine/threonine protein kinase
MTVGSDESAAGQRDQLEGLIRSSLASEGRIDETLFRDYAHKFLLDLLVPPRKQSVFALTPVTGAIVDYTDLEKVKPLGSGGFGQVFVYRQRKKNREVALKVLTPSRDGNRNVDQATEDRNLCNALREIVGQIYCAHPAVLPFVGWNYVRTPDPPQVLILTELMAGGTIQEHLHVNATRKMIYFYGSARGMAHCHRLGIIHRDLKLLNVFLDAQQCPRIADLGLAKLHEDTGQTAMAGSSEYMAPEVILNDDPSDREREVWSFPADVFAYAIMFWEIVTEKKWESGKSKFPFWKAVCNRQNPLRPDVNLVPPVYRGLLGRMWDYTTANRPTFEDICALLGQRSYWLPGTDKSVYLKYVNDLKRGEAQISLEGASECRRFLRQSQFSTELHDKLVKALYDDDLDPMTNKLIYALGYLSGTKGEPNQEVMTAIKESLTAGTFLDPVKVNSRAAQVVNPDDAKSEQ